MAQAYIQPLQRVKPLTSIHPSIHQNHGERREKERGASISSFRFAWSKASDHAPCRKQRHRSWVASGPHVSKYFCFLFLIYFFSYFCNLFGTIRDSTLVQGQCMYTRGFTFRKSFIRMNSAASLAEDHYRLPRRRGGKRWMTPASVIRVWALGQTGAAGLVLPTQ